jgi:hypothetical protein
MFESDGTPTIAVDFVYPTKEPIKDYCIYVVAEPIPNDAIPIFVGVTFYDADLWSEINKIPLPSLHLKIAELKANGTDAIIELCIARTDKDYAYQIRTLAVQNFKRKYGTILLNTTTGDEGENVVTDEELELHKRREEKLEAARDAYYARSRRRSAACREKISTTLKRLYAQGLKRTSGCFKKGHSLGKQTRFKKGRVSPRKGIRQKRVCLHCGNEFEGGRHGISKRKYCSNKCSGLAIGFIKGNRPPEHTLFKKGHSHSQRKQNARLVLPN